ncbi:uncharacterized protein BDZ83DRAFT_13097 [Colletotrichum acutatum]|uniref:Uncharacterized protein n=1 Tax=Glomerella acutata TaxID=27357 RepID=A0AAD9D016_GLOAC|nr:uncharacterized protein BDZ83DRAFT_13097 [Colletotrichum acutatum]KAK1729653.1 hypothetical protein BDZ83DRAFT_13097 [Colletotrichum acutatum]
MRRLYRLYSVPTAPRSWADAFWWEWEWTTFFFFFFFWVCWAGRHPRRAPSTCPHLTRGPPPFQPGQPSGVEVWHREVVPPSSTPPFTTHHLPPTPSPSTPQGLCWSPTMDQKARQSESISPAKREISSSKYTTDTSPMTDAKTSEPHRSLSPGPCSSVGRSILTTSRPPCDGNPQTKPFSNIPCVFHPTGLHSLRPYGEGGGLKLK